MRPRRMAVGSIVTVNKLGHEWHGQKVKVLQGSSKLVKTNTYAVGPIKGSLASDHIDGKYLLSSIRKEAKDLNFKDYLNVDYMPGQDTLVKKNAKKRKQASAKVIEAYKGSKHYEQDEEEAEDAAIAHYAERRRKKTLPTNKNHLADFKRRQAQSSNGRGGHPANYRSEDLDEATKHDAKKVTSGYDVYGKCSCGWTGKKFNYMSNNYAYTECQKDINRHKFSQKESVNEAYALSSTKTIDDSGEDRAISYGRKKGYKEVGVIGTSPRNWMVLFQLKPEDKKALKGMKFKPGEKVFRYATKSTVVGDIFPYIKVNLNKGLVYNLTQESSAGEIDAVAFETRATKLKFARIIDGAVDMREGAIPAEKGNTVTVVHKTSGKELVITKQALPRYEKMGFKLAEGFKVGQTVTPSKGPHKGQPHKVIHDHGDGSYNIKPHNIPPRSIKYRLGAAKANGADLKAVKEEYLGEMDKTQRSAGKEGGSTDTEKYLTNHKFSKSEAIKWFTNELPANFNAKTDLGYWSTKAGPLYVDLRSRGSDTQLKAAERNKPAGVKGYNNQYVESNEYLNEVLSFAQRRKKARDLKKNKARVRHGARRQERKMADNDRLQNRSKRQARLFLFKKLTKGKSKSEVPLARRISIEKRLEKMKGRIDRIAKKSLPKVRKQEVERIRNKRKGDDK